MLTIVVFSYVICIFSQSVKTPIEVSIDFFYDNYPNVYFDVRLGCECVRFPFPTVNIDVA